MIYFYLLINNDNIDNIFSGTMSEFSERLFYKGLMDVDEDYEFSCFSVIYSPSVRHKFWPF